MLTDVQTPFLGTLFVPLRVAMTVRTWRPRPPSRTRCSTTRSGRAWAPSMRRSRSDLGGSSSGSSGSSGSGGSSRGGGQQPAASSQPPAASSRKRELERERERERASRSTARSGASTGQSMLVCRRVRGNNKPFCAKLCLAILQTSNNSY